MNGYYFVAVLVFSLGALVLSLGLGFDAGTRACEEAHSITSAQPVAKGYNVTVAGIRRPLVRVIEF